MLTRARRSRALTILPALVLAAAGTAVATTPGYAACHSFSVSVNPDRVNEGGTTVATVSRDGAVNPSSVQVDTVDESAVAGRDYGPIHQRLSFSTETSQTIQVTTIHNPAHEGAQTFRIQLSGGMGCAVNPHFVYGPPARVTVMDVDSAPVAPAPPATAATTGATAPARRPSPAPQAPAASAPAPSSEAQALAVSPSPSEVPSPSPSGTPPSSLAPAPTRAGGSGIPVAAVGLALVAAALGVAGFFWYRRRQAV